MIRAFRVQNPDTRELALHAGYILDAAGRKTGVLGTLGFSYPVATGHKRVDTGLTTPGTIALWNLLADARDAGVSALDAGRYTV